MKHTARLAGLLLLAGCLLLPACGGTGSATAAGPPAQQATPPASPEDAFVAAVRAVGVDMPTHSTKSMGTTICNLIKKRLDMGHGPTSAYQQQVDSVYSVYKITGTQAEAVVTSAVINLCPEHSGVLPAGQ